MNTRLYVKNLSATATYNELMDMFTTHGNVVEVNLRVEGAHNRSPGSEIVTMATSEGARAAVNALNGKQIGTLLVGGMQPTEGPAGPSGGKRAPPPPRQPPFLSPRTGHYRILSPVRFSSKSRSEGDL